MPAKLPRVHRPKPPPSTTRTRYIGLRLTEPDAEVLKALGRKEDVGVTTFARLILETYVRTHGRGRR